MKLRLILTKPPIAVWITEKRPWPAGCTGIDTRAASSTQDPATPIAAVTGRRKTSGMKYVSVAILCFGLWAGSLTARAGAPTPSPGSAVIASAGGYQLTEQMLEQTLRFGQILASADFSPSDTSALRADLIAYFATEPAKQMAAYESIAKILQQEGDHPSWLDFAILRYRWWQRLGDPQRFRESQRYPFGRMIQKYNPILINSGGMIVTKNDVDCQFYSDTMVAKAAGVAPPTEADKDQLVGTLSSRFASMPAEQKEYLREAEIRLAQFHIVYDGTMKTHAMVLADIRNNVRSPTDVSREARQVEKDADSGAIALQRAVAFEARLAVMQMQFQMQTAAAKAQKDAALALDRRYHYVPVPAENDAGPTVQYWPSHGAPGKYWQSYVNESNGPPVNDAIATLGELIKRSAASQASNQ